MNYNFDELISREGSDSVKFDLRKAMFGKPDVLPLWVADMDFKTPDFILKALKNRLEHPILGYTIRNEPFYNSVIKWLQRRHQWTVKKEWLGFTPGVVPGLAMSVLAFSKPGDKIIIQSPVYHPFHSTIKDLGRQLVDNKLVENNGNYLFDYENLEQLIDSRTKMIFLSNPHNPVGRVWKPDELLKIGEICSKHNLIIISDDIHSDLVLKPHKYTPIATLSPEIANQTLTFYAPSKTFNVAGLASSVFVTTNEKLLTQFNTVVHNLHLFGGNIFGNIGLTAAYEQGEEWLEQMLAYLKENFEYLKNFLTQKLPKIKLSEMEGTYLAWLDFREYGFSQTDLNNLLINKANLGLNSGEIFGETGIGFMRINLATSRIVLKEALDNLNESFSGL